MDYYIAESADARYVANTVYAIGLLSSNFSDDPSDSSSAADLSNTLSTLPEPLRGIARDSIHHFVQAQGCEAGSIQRISLDQSDAPPNCGIILLGLGEEAELDYSGLRHSAALITRIAKAHRYSTLQLHLPSSSYCLPHAELAILEGIDLSVFEGLWVRQQHQYKSVENLARDWEGLQLKEAQLFGARCCQQTLDSHKDFCRAVHLSRELVATPANIANPQELLNHARSISDNANLALTVFDEAALEQRGMNGLLAVSSGTTRPLFLHLQYKPDNAKRDALALIGLGITFDPDGLSLGHSGTIEGMKKNMAGAASVLAAAECIGRIKPDRQVDFILPLAERDGSLRPGDLLTLANGETVEINGEHIEGHLMLADAFIYAQSLGVKQILSMATLANDAIGCLGNRIAPLWSTTVQGQQHVVRAGEVAGEQLWPLPIVDEHQATLVSPFADCRTPKGEYGAGLTALFLQQFAGDGGWSHIDISGTCWSAVVDGYLNAGATGWGVGTLVNWVACCD